jgi:peptidyl-prolyl cis-trans isomerase A (cyclophilin A)
MRRSLIVAALAAAIVAGVAAASSSGPSLLHPASLHKRAPATFSAKFVTTKGPFVIKVTRSWSPHGADRFYNLVYYHFYDNQPLFRVIRGQFTQWGISSTPAIAKAWRYATIKDDPVTHDNVKGTVTFANSNPKNSRTTQVFVNLGTNSYLNKRHGFSPIGVVTKGLWAVFSHLYAGYGQGPSDHQDLLAKGGAHWIHTNYPKLDWIKTARLVH